MILEKIGNHTLLNDDTNVGLKYLIDKKIETHRLKILNKRSNPWNSIIK